MSREDARTALDAVNPAVPEDIRDVVRRLDEHLGETLVAALSGSRDSTITRRWVRPDDAKPPPQAQERLRVAYRVWQALTEAESANTALTWFTGDNPVLGTAPVLALREGRTRDVTLAAQAFLLGKWSA